MSSTLIFFLGLSSSSSSSSRLLFSDMGDISTWWADEGVVCLVDGERRLEGESLGDTEDVDSLVVWDPYDGSLTDASTSADASTVLGIAVQVEVPASLPRF